MTHSSAWIATSADLSKWMLVRCRYDRAMLRDAVICRGRIGRRRTTMTSSDHTFIGGLCDRKQARIGSISGPDPILWWPGLRLRVRGV